MYPHVIPKFNMLMFLIAFNYKVLKLTSMRVINLTTLVAASGFYKRLVFSDLSKKLELAKRVY